MSKAYKRLFKSLPDPWRKGLVAFVVLALLIFCVGLLVGYFKQTKTSPVAPVVMDQPLPLEKEVILYFATDDGQTLVAETRKVNECQLDEDCLRATVEALIAGPQGDLVPILPSQVELRSVAVAGSLVTLDFSQQLIAAHPGGTQSELLTIYGLADTLTVNFPHLRQLQLLVEGLPISTLKGHVDLRQPINPDFSLVKEGPAPVGEMNSLPAGREE